MSVNNARRDEVRTIILSLLVARPGATAVTMLDNDYYEMEGKRIPWRQFGHANLVEFLQSMPQHFALERRNGVCYVRGIASEKSRHVSSLVSRQKTIPRKSYVPSYVPPRLRSSYYVPNTRQKFRIPAEQLNMLVQYVRNSPNGINIQTALLMLQKQLPQCMLSVYDIQDQLRELAHQLYVDGEMIRPVQSNSNGYHHQEAANYPPPLIPAQLQNNVAQSSAQTYAPAGDESEVTDNDSNAVPAGYIRQPLRRPKMGERFEANFKRPQNALNHHDGNNSKNNENDYDDEDDDDDDDVGYLVDTKTAGYTEKNDVSMLISERVRSRLKQLAEKNPDGIWCTELPEKYLKEYNVSLNYTRLGFSSVREYVSYLPDIFYMMRQDSQGDFILYSAKKSPSDQETSEKRSENVPRTEPIEMPSSSSRKLRNQDDADDENDEDDDDVAPFPADISPSMWAKFVPEGAMTYGDTVSQILVSDLQNSKKQYQEVYVREVFTPSFFWVHLRGNTRQFDILMEELDSFYVQNSSNYSIPKVALIRGLNCACLYSGLWHRGIIKTVKPDFKVTVMFYDYGTQKTYIPEDVYYLHKQFAYLPAQAIPCGLYNVKPRGTDRWKQSITIRFKDRVFNDSLLAATIVSIDIKNNSMMIILTDTSEENDVHINDWLVQENLARRGKMVRMLTRCNFPFQHQMRCNNIALSESVEAENVVAVDVDDARYDRNRSISSCDEKTSKLSNAESNNKENVEVLRNVLHRRKAIAQTVRNVKSTESSVNANSRSTDCLANKKPRAPKELTMLLARLKASNVTLSGIGATVSSEADRENAGGNAQSIDLDARINATQSRNPRNYADYNCLESTTMEFILRDSDNEECNESDFGMFKSMYGGHGMMEPFDWTIIRDFHAGTLPNTSDSSKMCESNNEEKKKFVKFDEFFHDKKELAIKQCFLNVTRKEDEYFLADSNIDYDVRNVSQSVTKLKNRLEICNDKDTMIVVKKDILEMLRSGVLQSLDKLNSDATNVVENDGAASSSTMFRDTINVANDTGKSNEVCEMKVDRKTEVGESPDANAYANLYATATLNATSKLASPSVNGNGDNARNAQFEHNAKPIARGKKAGIFNPSYKLLLEEMKRMRSLDSSFGSSTKESSSSEQVRSSYSTRSHNSTDTMISSDDDQKTYAHESLMTRFDELRRSTLTRMSSSSLVSSSEIKEKEKISDSETKTDDSVDVSSADNIADSTKQHRPTCTIDDTRPSRMLRQVLRMQQNMESVTELDSDDLSDEKSASDVDGKSSNEQMDIGMSVVRVSTNNNDGANTSEETMQPPVFNDCDVESDESEWDVCAGPEHFPLSLPQAKAQITEISDDESESLKCTSKDNFIMPRN